MDGPESPSFGDTPRPSPSNLQTRRPPMMPRIAVPGTPPSPMVPPRLRRTRGGFFLPLERTWQEKLAETTELVMSSSVLVSDMVADMILLACLMYQWPVWIALIFVLCFRLPMILRNKSRDELLD